MPRLSFDTNLPASKFPEDFLGSCTEIISKTTEKKITFCISTLNPGLKMTMGGSSDPCGFVEITSIGAVGPQENKIHITAITDYIHQVTGIPKNKLLVQFQANQPGTIGFLGTTFHQLVNIEKGARLAPYH